MLATPGAQSLEVAGPVEVFSMVAEKLREAGRERMSGYAVEVQKDYPEIIVDPQPIFIQDGPLGKTPRLEARGHVELQPRPGQARIRSEELRRSSRGSR